MLYCKCKFRDTDERSYTYEWAGDEPIVPGDFVKVADNRGPDAWKRVRVVEVSEEAPNFVCKPILGRVEDEADDDSQFLKEMTK